MTRCVDTRNSQEKFYIWAKGNILETIPTTFHDNFENITWVKQSLRYRHAKIFEKYIDVSRDKSFYYKVFDFLIRSMHH